MELFLYKSAVSIGNCKIYTTEDKIAGISIGNAFDPNDEKKLMARSGMQIREVSEINSLAKNAVVQLEEYLAGKRKSFELPYKLFGTSFELKVWAELEKIPYGETVSYSQIAKGIGTKGIRAVGSAIGRNPLPIIIPCHRVVRSDGVIGNYSAGQGTQTKVQLLDLEKLNKGRLL